MDVKSLIEKRNNLMVDAQAVITKEAGLGLWVSSEIVQRHNGRLRFRSNQKKDHSGTAFTLFLPFDAVTR